MFCIRQLPCGSLSNSAAPFWAQNTSSPISFSRLSLPGALQDAV